MGLSEGNGFVNEGNRSVNEGNRSVNEGNRSVNEGNGAVSEENGSVNEGNGTEQTQRTKDHVCKDVEFQCGSGKCIPLRWQCDSEADCEDGSDEDPKHCVPMTCKDRDIPMWRCDMGMCIPKSWRCDEDPDCEDGSDEVNCLNKAECEADEFTCHNRGNKMNCIPLNWVCDGSADCDDESDEVSCNATCTSEQFTCSSGLCISKRWQCDGDNDCGDQDFSDEANCPNMTCLTSQMACADESCVDRSLVCDGKSDCSDGSDEHMQCSDGQCIEKSWKCDGEDDCFDGADEHNCPNATCSDDEYVCALRFPCIRREWLCDGDMDCPAGDDESAENCILPCPGDSFMCGDETCIHKKLLCNGFPECADESDEANCAPTCIEDAQFNCGTHCIPMELVCNGNDDCGNNADEPTDGTCGRNEYIDECMEPGICSQVCVNLKGSYKCECVGGYARDPHNHHRCKAMEGHASLLFARYTDIRKISLDHKEITAIVNETQGATALDFVFKTGMIFWTDVVAKCIYKAPIDEGSKMVKVITNDVTTVDGLAVDWLYNHIYWTNTDTDTIEVADFNGDMRKTLFHHSLDEPRAIALYPSEGWILDLVLRKVYWSDSKSNTIYSCDFDGSNRRVILHSTEYLPHPFSITVFEDTMYWTDWSKESIFRANKFTGEHVEVVTDSHANPMTVHVYHSYRQPNGTNHCTPLNGLCTHLCLPAPQTGPSDAKITCACPDGLLLMPDSLTCESEGECYRDVIRFLG
ncbi:Very low-density lipoprotein receptor-like 3 [Homarus americanus]|uniref:Very low-density lipoprotein receptor-like 3 n=1 Tax=Homarus americanus TaxID=6706 RepID=A0A8J5MNS9_HOMAM|nr:Very low-density lipoprotein receptor-like 3 [Homarus americanus]